MSSPSKKRKAARAWMHIAKKGFVAEGQSIGFREGAERIRADMMAILPDPDGMRIDQVTGKPHVRSIIKSFPNPYEHGPYFRVPMPEGGYGAMPMRDIGHTAAFAARMRTIDFRPIEHQITSDGLGGASTLTWFTWEPTEGSDEVEEHTSALFTGMGKLNFVANLVRSCAQQAMYSRECAALARELDQAANLLHECTEEFRRKLGRFAPVSNEDLYTQRERYSYAATGRSYR